MSIRTLYTSLLAGLLLGCVTQVGATQCAFKGQNGDARLVRFSGEVLMPEGWTSDNQCERLEVAGGVVRVMYQSAAGKLVETTVERGPLVRKGEGAPNGIFHQIGIMLAADQKTRLGMSRAAVDFDALYESFPAGHIVQSGVPLEIVLFDAEAARGAAFRLESTGKPPFSVIIRGGKLTLPVAVLEPGVSYRWSLKQGTNLVKGEFSVVSAADYAQVRKAIDGELGAQPEADTRLAVASRLVEQEYFLEARSVLRNYLK
ncbi:hypothetical protein [Herminiimonas sp. CN]|uniref:hypothetical protein n=1 Tax=Herminiimonas sp. CN TaxID=1349818 RepID=UPI0004731841|nr:hypothetical protein [Herminiimonas sp. CN]